MKKLIFSIISLIAFMIFTILPFHAEESEFCIKLPEVAEKGSEISALISSGISEPVYSFRVDFDISENCKFINCEILQSGEIYTSEVNNNRISIICIADDYFVDGDVFAVNFKVSKKAESSCKFFVESVSVINQKMEDISRHTVSESRFLVKDDTSSSEKIQNSEKIEESEKSQKSEKSSSSKSKKESSKSSSSEKSVKSKKEISKPSRKTISQSKNHLEDADETPDFPRYYDTLESSDTFGKTEIKYLLLGVFSSLFGVAIFFAVYKFLNHVKYKKSNL